MKPIRLSAAATALFALLLAYAMEAVPRLIAETPASADQAQSASPTLTLRDAVALALKKNPAVNASVAYFQAVARGITQAQAGWYPRVDFSEGFTRGDNPVYVFGTLLTQRSFATPDFALSLLNTPLPLDNFQTRFAASLPLYDAGQTRRRVRGARLQAGSAQQGQQRTQQEVVFETVQAYLGVLRERESLGVAQDAVRQSEADLHRALARQQQGFTVPSDVLSARAKLAQRRQDVIDAEDTLEIARATLYETIGAPETATYTMGGSFPQDQFKPGSSTQLEAEALSLRPDYRQAEIGVNQAANGVAMSREAFLPTVSSFAEWDRDSLALAGVGGRNWTAGVTLRFNIFNGGADRARLTCAFYRRREAEAIRDEMASRIRLQVHEAYLNVQAAHERIAASRPAASEARASLQIVENRYSAGIATINDVLEGETAYTSARRNYLNAVYDYALSVAALELATGELGSQAETLKLWRN